MTKTLSEEMSIYRNALLTESWDTKMKTPKSEKGKWDDWSVADLKAELTKLKNNPKKTDALKHREKQVAFAIRAKQKNKWGKIKESTILEGNGVSFDHLLKNYHMDVDAFIGGSDLSQELYDALYDYYFDEMPYGVAKARTGDPYEWITDEFTKQLEQEGLMDHGSIADDFNADVIGEGKTMRKCKGKGCDKKLTDGKNYCSQKCQSNSIDLKKEVPINKKLKEKYIPGPFSKKGYRVKM
jgi:hypothetical protein